MKNAKWGHGKKLGCANVKKKVHLVVGDKVVCNAFVIVPSFTSEPSKTNCINCKRWVRQNSLRNS